MNKLEERWHDVKKDRKKKRKLEERNITHFELKLAGREEIQNQSM
jgi:hypothetical protein